MSQLESHPIIPSLRASSRLLVRELGFMSSTIAGTPHSPSAVHAIIEIGLRQSAGEGITASALCTELNLEKSSVSRLLKKLVEGGEVSEGYKEGGDAREKVLGLTEKGRVTLGLIDTFGESQITSAFDRLLAPSTPDSILAGISAYATALRSCRLDTPPPLPPTPLLPVITIVPGYRPGLLARCLEMHMSYYARTSGFGVDFESMLATGFGELLGRLDGVTAEAFSSLDSAGRIRGTVFVDGVDLARQTSAESPLDPEYLAAVNGHVGKKAHLRGFIVDDGLRGCGVGKRMLEQATTWSDEKGYEELHLWTFKGLDAARKLYERAGFGLRDEAERKMWEKKELLVQHFVRIKQASTGVNGVVASV